MTINRYCESDYRHILVLLCSYVYWYYKFIISLLELVYNLKKIGKRFKSFGLSVSKQVYYRIVYSAHVKVYQNFIPKMISTPYEGKHVINTINYHS